MPPPDRHRAKQWKPSATPWVSNLRSRSPESLPPNGVPASDLKQLVRGPGDAPTGPASREAVEALGHALGVQSPLPVAGEPPAERRAGFRSEAVSPRPG